jgi:anti-sigma-K factor RskA
VNLKEYISSGIVESYVLGIATEAEREEFEAMCQQHPEIVQARNQFEMLLENKLLQDAALPPENAKEKLLVLLTTSDTPSNTDIQVNDEAPVRRLNIWKIMAAASIVLLAGTVFWAYTVNNENRRLKQDLVKNNERDSSEFRKAREIEAEVGLMQQESSVKVATLLNTDTDKKCLFHVYWNATTGEAYILDNNLQPPAPDKQYQLWALLDGTPINKGVLDITIKKDRLLQKAKRGTQNAQGFAVSIEPKGTDPIKPTTVVAVGTL